MKKSSFVTMLLGTISIMLFALGMCMTLIPAWSAFRPGIVFGCMGILMGLITLMVWRKMERKAPLRLSGKTILSVVTGVAGALALGVGICFCMVWNRIILGACIGLVGILILLCLIPMVKGIQD